MLHLGLSWWSPTVNSLHTKGALNSSIKLINIQEDINWLLTQNFRQQHPRNFGQGHQGTNGDENALGYLMSIQNRQDLGI